MFKKVVVIEILISWIFMYLDIVFIMIDYDKFIMYLVILKVEGNMNIFIIEYDDVNKDIVIK